MRIIFCCLWVLKSIECWGTLGAGELVYNQTGKLSKQSHLPRWYCLKTSKHTLGSQVTICPRRALLQQEKMEGESAITAQQSTRVASRFWVVRGVLPQDQGSLRLGFTHT